MMNTTVPEFTPGFIVILAPGLASDTRKPARNRGIAAVRFFEPTSGGSAPRVFVATVAVGKPSVRKAGLLVLSKLAKLLTTLRPRESAELK